jgi:uncharacterized protein (TIGR02599 family)
MIPMRRHESAFTLVELMVSTTILVLMMIILLQMTGQTANTWRYGAAKAEQFQEARKAFETVTRRISEATLNTYWDYYVPPRDPQNSTDPTKPPTAYVRQSDLRFRVVNMASPTFSTGGIFRPTQGVFFQAPVGMVDDVDTPLANLDDLLNSWGYFVEVDTTSRVPSFLESTFPTRTRARLMEFRQPSEEFDLYKRLQAKLAKQMTGAATTNGEIPNRDPVIGGNGRAAAEDDDWFAEQVRLPATNIKRRTRVLAENILALVVLPRLSPTDERARKENVSKADSFNLQKDKILLTPNFEYHSKQLSNYVTDPAVSSTYEPNDKSRDPELNPKNQLPPVVQIAMFAIDENSAQRLAETYRSGDLGLTEMMKVGKAAEELFRDATKLETSKDATTPNDLAKFEKTLTDLKLSYRLFSSNVAIRGAKWSRAQVK